MLNLAQLGLNCLANWEII